MEKKEKNTILLLSITSLVNDHVNFTRRTVTPIRKEKKKNLPRNQLLGLERTCLSPLFFFV